MMFQNIIFDKHYRQITINKDPYDRILSVNLWHQHMLNVEAYEEDGALQHSLLNPYNKIDKYAAVAIISYLWNKFEINMHIKGHSDLNHSNTSLSYHIILKGLDVFDVTIGALEDPSYSIHLSSSEIECMDLPQTPVRCEHPHHRILEEDSVDDTKMHCDSAVVPSINTLSQPFNNDLSYESPIIKEYLELHTEEQEQESSHWLEGSLNIDDIIGLCSGQFHKNGLIPT